MSILRPRNRTVYFRVSEDEFDRFNNIRQSTGARSISDLARAAMQSMTVEAYQDPHGRLADKLTTLESMVSDLNHKIHQLTLYLGRHDAMILKPTDALEARTDTETGSET